MRAGVALPRAFVFGVYLCGLGLLLLLVPNLLLRTFGGANHERSVDQAQWYVRTLSGLFLHPRGAARGLIDLVTAAWTWLELRRDRKGRSGPSPSIGRVRSL